MPVCLGLGVLFGYVLLPVSGAAVLAADQQLVNTRLEKIYSDERYQTGFPVPVETQNPSRAPGQTPPPAPSQAPLPDEPPARQQDPSTIDIPVELIWLLGAGVLIFFLLRAGKAVPKQRHREPEVEKPVQQFTVRHRKADPSLLEQADSMAAAGDYPGAVQVLLRLSIEAVKGQFNHHVLPSLTNREILQQARLNNTARQAFSAIVAVEEGSQFARHPLDVAGFDDCRRQFLTLVQEIRQADMVTENRHVT